MSKRYYVIGTEGTVENIIVSSNPQSLGYPPGYTFLSFEDVPQSYNIGDAVA